MKSSEAVKALGALAQESRLVVFRLLVQRGPHGFTPSELLERVEIPAPTLSFHLKELVNGGLVTSRREGRNVYYGPNIEHVTALMGFLTESCCSLAEVSTDPGDKPAAVDSRRPRRARGFRPNH